MRLARSCVLLSFIGCICFIACTKKSTISRRGDDALQAQAVDAYIYGYPIVTMEMTRKVLTNTRTAGDRKAPMNQFAHVLSYPDPSFHDVTTPNADTLYSFAWLDLSKEPIILHVPNERGRYYLMPMLDAWTNVFASPGTRTTGTEAQDFAITGPNWTGRLPQRVQELKSPTNLAWILGRTYSSGKQDDLRIVNNIQRQYSLTPLSAYGKPYSPPPGNIDPNIDMKTPVRDQVNHLSAEQFFGMLADLLKNNPPAKEDGPMVSLLAKLGIDPNKPFNFQELDPTVRLSLEKAPQLGQRKIQSVGDFVPHVNGWTWLADTGKYGTNYLYRAYVTMFGLGANLSQDALYPFTTVDADGNPLNGQNQYVIHFTRNQLPPVRAFWSLTLYNSDLFFVQNPLNRYTLSQRDPLKFNQDGSLTLFIQNASPGKDRESNWLPAPEGDFTLMLRLYWPEEPILSGQWTPPAVQHIS